MKKSGRYLYYLISREGLNTKTHYISSFLFCSFALSLSLNIYANDTIQTLKSQTTSHTYTLESLQERFSLSGQIVDAGGMPLPGATVSVENTARGVITDFDGNFTIEVSLNETLIIQMLGFRTETVIVVNKQNLNITLSESVEYLDEVIITDGYQQVDRRLFAGVATKLNVEDIKIQGVTDASRLLEGRTAGVVVDNLSGAFGASPRIRIRGNTSINGNNKPLWVVDGVILEDNIELGQNEWIFY